MTLCATWSKPTFWSTTTMKATEAMAITSQGTHQRELRRRSLKVLLGATKVLTRRSASDNGVGAVCGAAAGMELMSNAPSARSSDSSCGRGEGQQSWKAAFSNQHLAFSPCNQVESS